LVNGPAKGKRDPEMHQTKKGNQWYHGMKAHIGVDDRSELVYTLFALSNLWIVRRKLLAAA